MSVSEKLTAIADTIRQYTHGTEKLSLDEMPDEIVYVAYDQHALGHSQGYDDGRQAVYDEFWDAFQDCGNRVGYRHGFCLWNDSLFYPKYSIKPTGSVTYLFYDYNLDNSNNVIGYVDFSERFVECGIEFDTSKVTEFAYFAASNAIVRLPKISTISATKLNNAFAYARHCHTVEKLVLKEDGSQTFASAFNYCTALENIVIEGVIGNDLDMRYSPLNRASIESVVSHLSTASQGKTLILKSGLVDSVFETSEGAGDGAAVFEALIANKKNWKFSY